MANLRKHVAVLECLIFLDLLSYVSSEFTADVVHGLSLSISEMKSDMANIKRRIENVEKKVQDTCISTTVPPQLEGRAITVEEIIDIKEDMNMQALAIKKTLTAEKLLLRETVETFESKFAEMESKIQTDITSIYASLENRAEMMFDRINSSSSALADGIAKLTSDINYTTTLINSSLEGKAEVMFDGINSSSSALADGIAKLISDFNYTNNDIRQSLKTMETSMMFKFGDIETRMIADITMIQKQNEFDANTSAVALATGIAGLTSKWNYTLNEMGELFKTMEETMESNMSEFEKKMTDDVAKKQNATQSTLSLLQAKLNSLDSTVTSISYIQTHIIKPELLSLSSQISSVSTSLSSRISSLESSSRYIAFHASDPRNWSPRDGEIVVFQYVYLNAGGGYDRTNGIFRAPVYGLYLFSAHFCNAIGSAIVYSIYVGEQRITTSTIVDEMQTACSSVTAVKIVDLGQTVTVRGAYGANVLNADYHRQPYFIGVLIRA